MQGTGALHPPTEPKFTLSGIPERLFHSFGPLFIDRFSSTPEEKRKKRE